MKPNKKIILLVIFIAAFIQIIIISYNQFRGFIQVNSIGFFLERLLIGTTFSSVFGLIIIYLDLVFIRILDKSFPSPQSLLSRIPLEFTLSILVGVIVGSIITITANLFFPYPNGVLINIVYNSMITSVLNIIIVAVAEAVLWFKRGQQSQVKSEVLEKENMQIRFETLKSQLNPHFLFNSLNVLSTIIKKDADKAQSFIDEFSSVYRYTLDVIEKPVVKLQEELDYAKSYLYLQKIRFADAVTSEINVDAQKLDCFVPPLAVQTLLENAFKHNRASSENPLKIIIYSEGKNLVVKNNLQPKMRGSDSKGVGLENLKKRYQLLGNEEPQFTITETEYVAKIPLTIPD